MAKLLILAAACVVVILTGCTRESRVDDDITDEIAAQLAEIDSLRGENQKLADRSAALSDSLDGLVSNLHEMVGEVRRQKKLRLLLDDPRTGLWEPGPDAMSIRFAGNVSAGTLSDLVEAFNERFADPHHPRLLLLSAEGSTAHVGVSDDALLTERMGSAGSGIYIASMTYALTSFPGIDRVFLDIRPGSHAGPGYLSRATFVDLVRGN